MSWPDLAQGAPDISQHDQLFAEQLRLGRDGLLNLSVYAVSMLAGMVLVPVLLNGLSREMYGLWIAALALQYSFAFLSGGLGRCVAREIAMNDVTRPNQFLIAAGYIYALVGIGGAAIIGLLGLPLASGLHVSTNNIAIAHLTFGIAGLGFLADQVQAYSLEILTGLRRFGIISYLANGSVILRTFGVILLLKTGFSILSIALWHVMVCIATAAFAYILAVSFAPHLRPQKISIRWTEISEQLRFSFAGQMAAAATNVLWRSAPLLLGLLRGAPAIVPYELGSKLPMSVSSISWQAAEVFFPAATEYHSTQKLEHTRQLLIVGTRAVLFVVLPLCVVLFVLAPDLLRIWVGVTSLDAIWTLRLLSTAVLIDSAAATSIQVIWGRGQIKLVSQLAIASAAVAILCGFILIGHLGILGAAAGMLAGVCVSSLGFVLYASRSCRLSSRELWPPALRDFTIPVALMAAVLAASRWHNEKVGWRHLALWATSSFIVYAGSFYIFGMASTEKRVVVGVFLSTRKRMYSAYQSIRRILERNHAIRVAILYAVEVKNTLLDSSDRDRAAVERLFRGKEDPFGFDRSLEQFRFQRAMEILESAGVKGNFPRALEIGCAEGTFTRSLAGHCDSLVAVDLSKVALDRAIRLCSDLPNVTFAEWDVRKDPIKGPFDLIVATGVLEYILRPSSLRDVRDRIAEGLRPGGYLLLGNTQTDNGVEKTWVGRKLIRGTLINDLFAADSRFEVVSSSLDQCVCVFAHTLLRKRK
jgi:O-antigen/teichoic acid export membrane protein